MAASASKRPHGDAAFACEGCSQPKLLYVKCGAGHSACLDCCARASGSCGSNGCAEPAFERTIANLCANKFLTTLGRRLCSNAGCERMILRDAFAQHVADECDHRAVQCPCAGCDAVVKALDLDAHARTCPRRTLFCPHAGCDWSVVAVDAPAGAVGAHILVCDRLLVRCPFRGCDGAVIAQGDFIDHLEGPLHNATLSPVDATAAHGEVRFDIAGTSSKCTSVSVRGTVVLRVAPDVFVGVEIIPHPANRMYLELSVVSFSRRHASLHPDYTLSLVRVSQVGGVGDKVEIPVWISRLDSPDSGRTPQRKHARFVLSTAGIVSGNKTVVAEVGVAIANARVGPVGDCMFGVPDVQLVGGAAVAAVAAMAADDFDIADVEPGPDGLLFG